MLRKPTMAANTRDHRPAAVMTPFTYRPVMGGNDSALTGALCGSGVLACRFMGGSWREVLQIDRPPVPTPASRRLRRLILTTAVVTVVVDIVNLEYSAEAGFGLAVRTVWAILR